MMTGSTEQALSRRAALQGLGAGSLAMLAARLVAVAQEATPEDVVFSRVDHPLLGAWQWNMNLNFDRDSQIAVLSRSGQYLEFDPVAGLGVGFWRATGADTGECFAQYQGLAGTWQRIAGPEELFDPGYEPKAFTYRREIVTTQTMLRLRDDGMGILQTGTFRAYVPNGTNAYTTGLTRTGIRLVSGE